MIRSLEARDLMSTIFSSDNLETVMRAIETNTAKVLLLV